MPSEKQIESVMAIVADKAKTDGFVSHREVVSIALTAAEQAEPAPALASDKPAVISKDAPSSLAFNSMAEMIANEPAPAARSGAVKVRALEWVERYSKFGPVFLAKSPIGLYSVATASGQGCKGTWYWLTPDDFRKGWGNSEAETKAAAQADYERRILTDLEPAEPATLCVGCEGNPSSENNPCAICGKPAEPATDAEAFESCPDCAGSGYSNHPDSGQVCYRCNGQGSYARPPESQKPTHRHKKRGSEYVLLGYGKMQAQDWKSPNSCGAYVHPVDMHEVAIYRDVNDNTLWVRPREEFEDGRFEELT